jgi:hypothetical protein
MAPFYRRDNQSYFEDLKMSLIQDHRGLDKILVTPRTTEPGRRNHGLHRDALATIASDHDHQKRGSRAFGRNHPVFLVEEDSQPVPSAWEETHTTSPGAKQPKHGKGRSRFAPKPQVAGSSTNEAQSFARIGNGQTVLSRRIVYSILLHSTATLPAMYIEEGELLC